MGLKEDVIKAVKQQPVKNKKTVNATKIVNLGSGRKSTYSYDGEGRPVNEGCYSDFIDSQKLDK